MPSTRQDTSPQPLYHEVCSLPLCYNLSFWDLFEVPLLKVTQEKNWSRCFNLRHEQFFSVVVVGSMQMGGKLVINFWWACLIHNSWWDGYGNNFSLFWEREKKFCGDHPTSDAFSFPLFLMPTTKKIRNMAAQKSWQKKNGPVGLKSLNCYQLWTVAVAQWLSNYLLIHMSWVCLMSCGFTYWILSKATFLH